MLKVNSHIMVLCESIKNIIESVNPYGVNPYDEVQPIDYLNYIKEGYAYSLIDQLEEIWKEAQNDDDLMETLEDMGCKKWVYNEIINDLKYYKNLSAEELQNIYNNRLCPL